LINVIGNHSNTVTYSIASNIAGNTTCELFLTAQPFLNRIYDPFYTKILPCSIGFAFKDGVYDCDPILPPHFDKCYIDKSTIKYLANTWITAHPQTANTTKYLTSDCPMDYCLPYSSNINLLHPDI